MTQIGTLLFGVDVDTAQADRAVQQSATSFSGAYDSAADAVASSVNSALSSVAGSFDGVSEAAASSGREVATAYDSAAEGIESSLTGAAEASDAALSSIGETAGESITTEFAGVADSVEGSLTEAAASSDAALTEIGTDAAASLTDEFGRAADGIVTSTQNAADQASAALDDIGSDISIDIPVEVDTGDVDALAESVEGLGEGFTNTGAQAEEGASGLDTFLTATTILNDAATVTSGVVDGIAEAMNGVDRPAIGLIGAVTGVATTLGAFAAAGATAIESNERLTDTFGQSAVAVRDLNVGNLTDDLSELAVQLGSSDTGLQNAAVGIGRLGIASGATEQQVSKTASEVLALALQVRALNPDLGSAEQIAEGLTNALGRGGRTAAAYNIELSATEIAARGVEMGLAASAEELSQYDKLTAGAAIAAERYGATLAEDVAGALDDVAIRQDRLGQAFGNLAQELGQDITLPVLDLLEALLPLGELAIIVVGAFAQALVPPIEALTWLGERLEGVIGWIGELNPDLIGLVAGFVAASAGIGAFVTSITAGIAVANPVLAGFLAVVGTAAVIGASWNTIFGDSGADQFAAEVEEATAALTDTAGALRLTDEALSDYIETTSRFESRNQIDDIRRLGLTAEQTAELIHQGAEGLDEFIERAIRSGDVTEVTAEAFDRYSDGLADGLTNARSYTEVAGRMLTGNTDLIKSFEEVAAVEQEAAKNQLALGASSGDLDESFVELGESTGDYRAALIEAEAAQDANAVAVLSNALATGQLSRAQYESVLAASQAADGTDDYSAALDLLQQKNLEAYEQQEQLNQQLIGIATRLPEVGQALAGVTDGTGSLSLGLVDLAIQLQGAAVTGADLDTVAAGLGITTDQLTAFIEGTQSALTAFVETAVGAMPSLGDAFSNAANTAKEAERPLSGKDIAAALAENLAAIRNQTANLGALVAAGYADIAAVASQQGPEAVAAIAQSLQDKDFKTLESIRGNLAAIPTAFNELTSTVQPLAAGFVAASGEQGALALQTFGANYDPAGLMPGVWDAAKIAQGVGADELLPQAQYLGAGVTTAFGTGVNSEGGLEGLLNSSVEKAKGAIETSKPSLLAALTGAGEESTNAFSGVLRLVSRTQDALNAATGAVNNGKGSLVSAAGTAGSETGGALGSDFVSSSAGAVAKGVVEGSTAIRAVGFALEIQARASGYDVGESLGSGMVAGINSYVGRISNAAASAVRSAEAAARREARSQSPSKLFADLGADLGAGVAVGLEASERGVVAAAEAIVRAAADVSSNVAVANTGGVMALSAAGGSRDALAVGRPSSSTSSSQQLVVSPGAIVVRIEGGTPSDADLVAVGGRIMEGLTAQFISDRDLALDLRMVGQQ